MIDTTFEIMRSSKSLHDQYPSSWCMQIWEEKIPYSEQPPSTGLTDALTFAKEKGIEFIDWAKVEVPKAIDTIKEKADELQQK